MRLCLISLLLLLRYESVQLFFLFVHVCVCEGTGVCVCVFRCATEAAAVASSVLHVTRPSRCGSEETLTACGTLLGMSWLSPP